MRSIALAACLVFVPLAASAAPPTRTQLSAAKRTFRQFIRTNPKYKTLYRTELRATRPPAHDTAALIWAGSAGASVAMAMHGSPLLWVNAATQVAAAVVFHMSGNRPAATARTVEQILDDRAAPPEIEGRLKLLK